MTPIKFILFVLFLLPDRGRAQAAITGLGPYKVGITTVDSLNATDFKEADQLFVKGTIALPCTHIRLFNAVRHTGTGPVANNLSLFFYDNTLFKISCDYSDALRASFMLTHGAGHSRPTYNLQLCPNSTGKPMQIWGEIWYSGAIQALAVHTSGYTTDCQFEVKHTLDIVSSRMAALASDCDLGSINHYPEEYERVLKAHNEPTGQQP